MSSRAKPGLIVSFLLKFFTDKDSNFEILGDFEEIFNETAKEKGIREARKWYRQQLIRSIPSFVGTRILWSLIMWKNYFRTALRNLIRNKITNILNITGLTIGLVCAMLIMLWSVDELNYDNFHKNSDRIFRIDSVMKFAGKRAVWSATPARLGPEMVKSFAEVEKTVTMNRIYNSTLSYRNRKFYEDNIVLTTPGIFDVFDIEFENGSAETAFIDLNSILLTRKLATKYFGKENPLGKTITINGRHSFKVTGIIKNLPHNTSLNFDCLLNFECNSIFGNTDHTWGRYDFYTYGMIKESADFSTLQKKIKNFIKNFEEAKTEFKVVPLKQIHLNPDNGEGNITYIYLFSIIGTMILMIACINFINLTTAGSALREKEIGIRKILGAGRKRLIYQIFTESLILVLLSYTAALFLTSIILPFFSNFTGKEFSFAILLNPEYMLVQSFIVVITAAISSSYPAFSLSSIKPSQSLRVSTSSWMKGGGIRKVLIVVQFSISATLIISTINISNQLEFIKNKELGFNKENLLYIKINRRDNGSAMAFRTAITALPQVKVCASSSSIPVNMGNFTMINRWEGKTDKRKLKFNTMATDELYLKTMDIQVIEGNDFTSSSPANAILINQKAVKEMGLQNPVGKKLNLWGKDRIITGVVKDFHFKPLSTDISPVIIRFDKGRIANYLFIRINPGNITSAINSIKEKFNSITPDSPFVFAFLDDRLNRLYRNEQKTGRLIEIFSILAVLTSALGLFGLSAFTARRRIREIGIRKVLGAKIQNLVFNLTREFIILIAISNIIAWIPGYYFIDLWLGSYAYRTSLSYASFISALFIALVIGGVTVSYHTFSAATSDPVKCIKDE